MLNKVGLEMLVAHFGQPLIITNGVSLTNKKRYKSASRVSAEFQIRI